jgi:hypothetical protein
MHRYQKTCSKLLAQFKTLRETVTEFVPDGTFTSYPSNSVHIVCVVCENDLCIHVIVERFMRDHHMNCKAAANRIRVGVPATVSNE